MFQSLLNLFHKSSKTSARRRKPRAVPKFRPQFESLESRELMAWAALPPETISPPAIVSTLDGNDTIAGGAGNDVIYGGAGDDTLSGAGQVNESFGTLPNSHSDLPSGVFQDDDTIFGGDGNDHLYGDQGNDQLFGGEGNDSFYFDDLDLSFVTEPGETAKRRN